MLHTIEFTQSVGSFTSVMRSSAIILSSSDLYKGSMCIGTACAWGMYNWDWIVNQLNVEASQFSETILVLF